MTINHKIAVCKLNFQYNRWFEDSKRSIPDLKLFCFRTFLDWLFSLRNKSFSSIFDFLDSCNFCIWPLYTPCVLGCPFLKSRNLFTYQKKTFDTMNILDTAVYIHHISITCSRIQSSLIVVSEQWTWISELNSLTFMSISFAALMQLVLHIPLLMSLSTLHHLEG